MFILGMIVAAEFAITWEALAVVLTAAIALVSGVWAANRKVSSHARREGALDDIMPWFRPSGPDDPLERKTLPEMIKYSIEKLDAMENTNAEWRGKTNDKLDCLDRKVTGFGVRLDDHLNDEEEKIDRLSDKIDRRILDDANERRHEERRSDT